MSYGKSIPEAIGGASAIAVALLTPFLRRRRTTWGTTLQERAQIWPGDNLVPEPSWQSTMAITSASPTPRVWPWIAQIGQGRGGFYSYERLENLVGCGIENATRILPSLQSIAVGDPIRLHSAAPPLIVASVEPERSLVLCGNPADSASSGAPSPDVVTSWALVLEARDSATRLVSRTRYYHGPGLRSAILGGPALLEPVSFVMCRKMLTVIKRLAEGGAAWRSGARRH